MLTLCKVKQLNVCRGSICTITRKGGKIMKSSVLNKGNVADISNSVATIEPENVTVNKAIVKKDVTKMATETKKAVAKAITEEKKEATKKETAKKETVKKDAPKKAVAKKEAAPKKEAAKAGKKEVFVQFGNREVSTDELMAKVEAAYSAEGHKIAASDNIRIYVKPEENMLYYVVNDSYASGINLFD